MGDVLRNGGYAPLFFMQSANKHIMPLRRREVRRRRRKRFFDIYLAVR